MRSIHRSRLVLALAALTAIAVTVPTTVASASSS